MFGRLWRRKVERRSSAALASPRAAKVKRVRRQTLVLEALEERTLMDAGLAWTGYAHDSQHTGVSAVASQPLEVVRWQTPVDLNPQYDGNDLLIHYGSPLVTPANTVIVPVKTGATGGFEVDGRSGTNGALLWTQSTDYVLPPSYTYDWTPSYSPTLAPAAGGETRLYLPGAGGSVIYRDTPDATSGTTGRLAFYGTYDPSYNDKVFIDTPITSDSAGDIYFGFFVTGSTSQNLQSGIARIDPSGHGTWTAASTAAGNPAIIKVVHNCAPALSNDQQTLYIAVSNSYPFGVGYLVALDSTSLAPVGKVLLKDVRFPTFNAYLPDDGTASPTVGPDGDVYFGVYDVAGTSKGWLLHFSGDLTQTKTPGAFGWDDTASIVPASMVPSYQGTSSYLLMTKYNNYVETGGDGVNKIAILDPNATMIDPRMGVTVMKEVLTIAGPTPDEQFLHDHPNAVREWCINTAAVDPATDSVLANSEDGKLYRWDLTTNSFTEVVTLTPGIGEAYTPTVIGVDGTVYAINNATLFAVGRASVPTVTCSVAAPVLWSPNHQLVNVGLHVSASDELDPNPVIQIQVFANDGASESDAAAVGADTLSLRSERQGNGDGRVYLIVVTATNKYGEVGVSVCTVFVPYDNSPQAIASAQAQADEAEAFYLEFGEPPLGYSLIGKSPTR